MLICFRLLAIGIILIMLSDRFKKCSMHSNIFHLGEILLKFQKLIKKRIRIHIGIIDTKNCKHFNPTKKLEIYL